MESSWRYNVWYLGLSGTPFRFIARRRGLVGAYYGLWIRPGNTNLIYLLSVVPGQLPTMGVIAEVGQNYRFANGYLVEPDNVFP